MPRKIVSRLAVAMLIIAAAVGVHTQTASADDADWSVATAANDLGADRANYRYNVNPGEHVDDGMVVANQGSADLRLQIYSADGFTNRGGQLDLRPHTARATDVGAWVTPGTDRLVIKPGASVTVPFVVAVPADARAGDHVGGIVASLSSRGSDGQVEERRGIRITVRVGGGLRPAVAVEGLQITYASGGLVGTGTATVSYTVHNVGNAVLGARQTVAVSGPFHRWQAKPGRVADAPQLLPGERWRVTVPVSGVTPAVRLTATVRIVPLLADAAGSTMPLAAGSTTAHAAAIPWTAVVVVIMLGGAAVGAVAYRRRKARGRRVSLT